MTTTATATDINAHNPFVNHEIRLYVDLPSRDALTCGTALRYDPTQPRLYWERRECVDAHFPARNHQGDVMGVVCVLDNKPTEKQYAAARALLQSDAPTTFAALADALGATPYPYNKKR